VYPKLLAFLAKETRQKWPFFDLIFGCEDLQSPLFGGGGETLPIGMAITIEQQ
jgi:hypothetical protein